MPATLQEKQAQRRRDIATNQSLGVIEYESPERQAPEVFEVLQGYVHLPGGIRIGPGQRFHPTAKQLAQTRKGKGGLTNKARELSATEMDGLGRGARPARSTGADIGLRSLNMEKDALKLAMDAGLKEEDFADVPAGRFGRYTVEQVQTAIAARERKVD